MTQEEVDLEEKEYLFIASGILHSINCYGMIIRSSDCNINTFSFLLNDNVFPPFVTHKFIREDIIKIRDYLNEYLDRTNDLTSIPNSSD